MAVPVTMEIQVMFYDSYCLEGLITPPTLSDMIMEVRLPIVPSVQVMPEWSHSLDPTIEDCSARTYTLSGDAFNLGLISVNAVTRTLEVLTVQAGMIGTYSAQVTSTIEGHEYIADLLEVSSNTFTVTITSACVDTELIINTSLTNMMAYVGEEPVVWVFQQWEDTISQGAYAYLTSRSDPFCEDR